MDAQKEIDTRGLNCPLPILKAKKALADMKSGDVLKVVATGATPKTDIVSYKEDGRDKTAEARRQFMDSQN